MKRVVKLDQLSQGKKKRFETPDVSVMLTSLKIQSFQMYPAEVRV